MSVVSIIPAKPLRAGDEVAILPAPDAPPAEVLEIAAVMYVGSVFLQLADGRMFATLGGKCIGTKVNGYVVPATDEHRAAVKSKSWQSGSVG